MKRMMFIAISCLWGILLCSVNTLKVGAQVRTGGQLLIVKLSNGNPFTFDTSEVTSVEEEKSTSRVILIMKGDALGNDRNFFWWRRTMKYSIALGEAGL